ncbi:hypothetical protein [Paenibacillus graminis]|uniref:hypothetical protein n=1 Tax=Paenibacillus graminis TaxID=189425 RepID=UPI002DBE6B70|nr:hypothetical protein [Paenibacillus graminis]MEC0171165.1 hypothetical protein [Paenibacillus graminis]
MTRKKEEQILNDAIPPDTKEGADSASEPTLLAREVTASPAENPLMGPRIYVGPNLPGGRLLQSTVFRGGVPAYLQPLLDEQPDIAALIVPVDELSEVQAKIVQTGTPEYVAYQAILKGGIANGI